MRILELFCGMGGVAEAVRRVPGTDIAGAIDIDHKSNDVYRLNYHHQPQCQTLESVRTLPDADLWWLSPPCQPYTQRGAGRAEDDPRSAALEHLIELIEDVRPGVVALENVPQFANSRHHRRLALMLQQHGYAVQDHLFCPTQWAIPMRRMRFYLRASRWVERLPEVEIRETGQPLASYLDADAWHDPCLQVSPLLREQYAQAMNIVDADDPHATTACFTSAYGKSPVRAGSYLRSANHNRVRRFAPCEIARLMGFEDPFRWPASCSHRDQYRMLGNSLSVDVTAAVLRSLIHPAPSASLTPPPLGHAS